MTMMMMMNCRWSGEYRFSGSALCDTLFC